MQPQNLIRMQIYISSVQAKLFRQLRFVQDLRRELHYIANQLLEGNVLFIQGLELFKQHSMHPEYSPYHDM